VQEELSKGTILVLDDEKNIRSSIQLALSPEGYHVLSCHEVTTALQALRENVVDLAIIDIRLGEIDGLTFFQKVRSEDIDVPTVFISGHASLTEAAKAVQLGAFDFLEKPFSPERLLLSVSRCLEHRALRERLSDLKRRFRETRLLGDTPEIHRIREQILRVSKSNSTVFVQGESGTGKELIAELIHESSDRNGRPFVKVNCSAIPETLLESELFGFERGAFTGANQAKKGYFELANGGTLFLDEVADLSLNAQAKVLRAIQSGEIQKIGSDRILKVNVRIVSASHKDLKTEVSGGRFREDLFYRLNVIPLRAPALRERADDVPLLSQAFLNHFCEVNGFKPKVIEPDVFERLRVYAWPGNVRELQNVIERMVIMSGERITAMDLPDEIFSTIPNIATDETPDSGLPGLRQFRDNAERSYIIETLRRFDGNITQAAKALQIERTYLHKRMLQFNIQKKDYFV
jgi:two-component system nitrogen regulation response regulator NtrX